MDGASQPRRWHRPDLVLSMGYQPPRKTYRLVFDEGEYAGLSVRVRSVPLGQFMALTRLAETAGDGKEQEAFAGMGELFEGFADALVDWNVEDDGAPVPADLSGVYAQDFDFVMFLVGEWISAMGDVAAPLVPPSVSGGTSLEASIPMDVLSLSPAS